MGWREGGGLVCFPLPSFTYFFSLSELVSKYSFSSTAHSTPVPIPEHWVNLLLPSFARGGTKAPCSERWSKGSGTTPAAEALQELGPPQNKAERSPLSLKPPESEFAGDKC